MARSTTRELKASLEQPYYFQAASDCEVISALHRQDADIGAWLNRLNGIFAFVLWDRENRRYLIARDPIGVVPVVLGPRWQWAVLRGLGDEGAGGRLQ